MKEASAGLVVTLHVGNSWSSATLVPVAPTHSPTLIVLSCRLVDLTYSRRFGVSFFRWKWLFSIVYAYFAGGIIVLDENCYQPHRRAPWEQRFLHSMSLPFYQAHPDQLERIEDNFDYFYRNLLGRKVR